MNILMPLADGQTIKPFTLASIAAQSIECNLIPLTRPMNKDCKRISEAKCRNELKQYSSGLYTFYLDSDAYFTSPTDVEDCIRFLYSNNDYDAVALDTKALGSIEKQSRKFVIIAAICIRQDVLENIEFKGDTEHCCCYHLNKDIKIKYLDHRRLGEIKRC